MESSFQVAILELDTAFPGFALEIEELLTKWRLETAYGIRIVDNLKSDCKIRVEIMKNILLALHANRKLPIAQLQKSVYEEKCHNFILQGPVVDIHKVGINIGGAKPIEDFVKSLKSGSRMMTQDRALKIVNKLNSEIKEPLLKWEAEISLSNYSCWCTWSEQNQFNPFDFVGEPNSLIKIVVNLGLSHRQSSSDHALFIYPKTVVDKIYCPTIADADIYTYFKCTSYTDYCGRTQPWNPPDYQLKNLLDEDVKPRPEGVHKPIKLKDLLRPVNIIKHVAA